MATSTSKYLATIAKPTLVAQNGKKGYMFFHVPQPREVSNNSLACLALNASVHLIC